MRVAVRAGVAVAMLAGFYALPLVALAGLVAAEVWFFRTRSLFEFGYATVFLAPLGFVLCRTLFMLGRAAEVPDVGVAVTPADQPRLWQRVRQIATLVGTRPPDEIRIGPDAATRVHEKIWPRRRQMVIGVPLFASFGEQEFAWVLAHELGHYSNHDTRLGELVRAGQAGLKRVVDNLDRRKAFQATVQLLFEAYAKQYFTLAMALSRRQELAADAVAARIAGSPAGVHALVEFTAVHLAWQLFTQPHLVRHLPADAFQDFTRFRESPEVQATLAKAAGQTTAPERYDTHPPMPQRIAAIEAMAAAPAAMWGDGPAIGLLDQPKELLDAVLLTTFAQKDRQ